METFAKNLLEEVELNIRLNQLRSRQTSGAGSSTYSFHDAAKRPKSKGRETSSPRETSLPKSKDKPTVSSSLNGKNLRRKANPIDDETKPPSAGRSAAERNSMNDLAKSDTGVYFRETKLKKELESLQLDVSVFHEAKIMHTHYEDLINEANSYRKLLSESFVTYELMLPDQNFSAEDLKGVANYWGSLKNEMKDRKSDSLNPLLRRIPVGTAKHLQNMHVLKTVYSEAFENEAGGQQEISEKMLLSMNNFLKEHSALRLRVDKLSSLKPKQKKNYNINHLYIHGSAGVRSDLEYDSSMVLGSNLGPTDMEGAEETGVDETQETTRDELMNKLREILEKTVDNRKLIESQILDIKLRGWNSIP
jgi:hypothetical protein